MARWVLVLTEPNHEMKFLCLFLLAAILAVLCWPLAILALLAWPIFWLLSIPFRVVGIVVGALLAFIKALLYLPARILGWRESHA
jgi:hypothetical protein